MRYRVNYKDRKPFLFIFILIFFCTISIIAVFILRTRPTPAIQQSTSTNTQPTQQQEAQSNSATFMAVGDMLIHDTIYNDFKTEDGYDFSPAFANVKQILQKGDFVALNQETPLGGEELGLSGLYIANSPQQLADAEVDAGFNMFQLANNHAMDRNIIGIDKTHQYLQKFNKSIITSGTYTSEQHRNTVPVIEKNGIKMAFLSYTYGSNIKTPIESWRINLIDKDSMARDIAAAKQQADIITVGVHWGIERDLLTSKAQDELASFLADQGVSIIYGTHPHVLQQPKWLNNNTTLYLPSLGNFLSIHTEKIPHTLTGAIAGVTITKNDSKISLSDSFMVPTWTYYTPAETDFTIIPFDMLTQEQYRFGDAAAMQQQTIQHLQAQMPDIQIKGLKDFIVQ